MFNFLKHFHVHKRKYVYRIFNGMLIGEPYSQLIKVLRICEKCGEFQEREITHKGSSWKILPTAEKKNLKVEIEDMGKYYILSNGKETYRNYS